LVEAYTILKGNIASADLYYTYPKDTKTFAYPPKRKTSHLSMIKLIMRPKTKQGRQGYRSS